MNEQILYNKYSDYLKEKYGEKVYKLPVNLPVTCPNRIGSYGCSFCAEAGTGFEAMDCHVSVTEQLESTKEHIRKRYKAKKYIAYFQNYTNTFLPLDRFREYILEAVKVPDIVEISVSTRPDCIADEYMIFLNEIKEKYKIDITIELGLQTVNYHTLDKINRGHGIAEFIDAVLTIQKYGFEICTHVILNLPGDTMRDTIETAKVLSSLHIDIVKLHSLYIPKNTRLCEEYENGTITLCSQDEYIERVAAFLEYISPDMIVERLFSRVPEKDAVFSNWGVSWWKLQDQLQEYMEKTDSFQGKAYHYLNGSALNKMNWRT